MKFIDQFEHLTVYELERRIDSREKIIKRLKGEIRSLNRLSKSKQLDKLDRAEAGTSVAAGECR